CVPRDYRVSRAFAAQLASNYGQLRNTDGLRLESSFFVQYGQLARAFRLAHARNRQVRMERSRFTRKPCLDTFILQRRMKQGQLARRVFGSDPQNARLTVRWKRATSTND